MTKLRILLNDGTKMVHRSAAKTAVEVNPDTKCVRSSSLDVHDYSVL